MLWKPLVSFWYSYYHRIIASFIFTKCVFCVRQKTFFAVKRGKFKTISFISWFTSDYWTYFLVYVYSHVFVVTVDYMCVTRNNGLSTSVQEYVYDRNRNRVGKLFENPGKQRILQYWFVISINWLWSTMMSNYEQSELIHQLLTQSSLYYTILYNAGINLLKD